MYRSSTLGSAVLALVLSVFTASAFAAGPDGSFPLHPDAQMTPGELCTTGQTHRYPEGITYCDRNVDRDLKRDLFRRYDVTLGYETQTMQRQDFKIDHYIPLCAGGSNGANNLWPQHKSVYTQTDPMEPLICQKMQIGVLKQAEAVQLIKKGKADFAQISSIMSYLQGLH